MSDDVLQPLEKVPTFEEESLTPAELQLLDHWTSLSPQMAAQRKVEGGPRPLGDAGPQAPDQDGPADAGVPSGQPEPAPGPSAGNVHGANLDAAARVEVLANLL